jgi:hypothetical protein
MQPELILFAKHPVAGHVKTRLQPVYSPRECAEVAVFLVRATVELVTANWPGEVSLYGAPDASHPLFAELAQQYGLRLAAQGDGDLGARMAAALGEGVARAGAAAIMGCDVPHCPWETIDQANDWLARGHYVIGAAEDGGYYFVGGPTAPASLFEQVGWGTPRALVQTVRQAQQLGIEFEWLPMLRDLDTPEDLRVVARAYEPLKRYVK